jgi:aspartate ammonia-lyase
MHGVFGARTGDRSDPQVKRSVAYRVESDLLGPVQVPAEALYGAQTRRALGNFPLGNQRTIGSFRTLIQALLLGKKAAALTNQKIAALDAARAGAILRACDQLLDHYPVEQFPVAALHGGGGTSANMNVNEVLANLGEELLGGRRGTYRHLHPNDHVNLHQSTNDVYPTACRVAIIRQWPALREALGGLVDAFLTKAEEVGGQRRLARTCLQDAVDTTWSDLFQGYVGFLQRNQTRLEQGVDALHAVNLGGSIIGRREDVPASYFEEILPALRHVTGDNAYHHAANLFDAAQNPDDLVAFSAELTLLARGLIKIAKDLRLLSSGPEAGLGELILPAAQPGSSVMPGKINPVIPEFLIQIGFRVIGNHAACVAGLDHGELDLNVWESSMVFPMLESMELLESGLTAFAERCVSGLSVDDERSRRNTETLIPLLTRLAQMHGYGNITAMCKEAGGDAVRLRRLLEERGLIG